MKITATVTAELDVELQMTNAYAIGFVDQGKFRVAAILNNIDYARDFLEIFMKKQADHGYRDVDYKIVKLNGWDSVL